jgi:hypothetical protein
LISGSKFRPVVHPYAAASKKVKFRVAKELKVAA